MKRQLSAKVILFISLVIVMLGFGIAIPLIPFYITHFNASAGAPGLMMSLYSILQFVFAPLWGRLSDRFGRKPILLTRIIFDTSLLDGRIDSGDCFCVRTQCIEGSR